MTPSPCTYLMRLKSSRSVRLNAVRSCGRSSTSLCGVERLFFARFNDPSSVPRITLRPLLALDDPNYTAVRFHMANILERTSIMRYLRTSRMGVLRRPSLAAAELRNSPATRQDLEDILALELDRQDDTHGSKNNWHSVFIVGLLYDSVLDWLIAAFKRPNYHPNRPLLDGIVLRHTLSGLTIPAKRDRSSAGASPRVEWMNWRQPSPIEGAAA